MAGSLKSVWPQNHELFPVAAALLTFGAASERNGWGGGPLSRCGAEPKKVGNLSSRKLTLLREQRSFVVLLTTTVWRKPDDYSTSKSLKYNIYPRPNFHAHFLPASGDHDTHEHAFWWSDATDVLVADKRSDHRQE